jgi:plastocyanin
MLAFLSRVKCGPALILLAALLSGCGAPSDETSEAAAVGVDQKVFPRPAEVTVHIDNFTFSPAKLTIAAGTKVTWINRDDVPHTATSSGKPRLFDSKTLDTDDKFSFVFTNPGTYDYFCALHKHMIGQIIVK